MWRKKNQEEIKERVFGALKENKNYSEETILGVPASHLDDQIFSQDATFLKDAPFISSLVQNPNHIGCHTIGESEHFFSGTQQIEKELLEICAVDILKGKANEFDGYVASGGTEANIQAIWIYRNFFQSNFNANLKEIAVVCSEDSHYSMDKASNLLCIDLIKISVDHSTRKLNPENLSAQLESAEQNGKRYFIVIANMMTTMFGSVDQIPVLLEALSNIKCEYKLHVDGAYGGFYFPFSKEDFQMGFNNPAVSSITIDAHKMAQAPYGTGIFLARKGLIEYTNTKEASYVEGEDYTLIGSRSGANAIAVWMILNKIGAHGWSEKVFILQKRTDWLCKQLSQRKISFFRNEYANIVTIEADQISLEVAERFSLVPDNHLNPSWYKIVVMDHVTVEKLEAFISELNK